MYFCIFHMVLTYIVFYPNERQLDRNIFFSIKMLLSLLWSLVALYGSAIAFNVLPSLRHCHNALAVSMTVSAKIALTRESGFNNKLLQLLPDLECHEIPCIDFQSVGNDVELSGAIVEHDVVMLTSPQAAGVFIETWAKIGKPHVKVATVGKGTSLPLLQVGISPVFEPSDATALALAEQLPRHVGDTILYPSSALADNVLVGGLEARGFKVSNIVVLLKSKTFV